ncbi:MAG: hypothetical protein K2Q25_14815 [Mycobacteriaceae bacterium]|nr:hypothetical protein [Mycobacteriaceae bacterium]
MTGRRVGVTGGTLLVAAIALIAACSSTVAGRPAAVPWGGTEPSFPSTRPSMSSPTTSTPQLPTQSTPRAPADATELPPDPDGYVFIETKSGTTRCEIDTDSVGCEAPFTNSPIKDGEHANGVSITADGTVDWVLGNLGAIPVVTIDYRTYYAQGWTIVATDSGTRFTNSRTGHGMFVSIEKVETY